MLKPERVTFSADDDKFNQFANSDQLNSFLNDSLVHYSTDFKRIDQQELTPIKHSNSLDELSSITMSSQQQQQQQIEYEPPASAPPSLLSEQIPILNETNLHKFDALTLQQLAIGSNQTLSNINEEDTKSSPSHSTSLVDIQKEIDRVKQMKYGRTYSSPTSSLCSRLTTNPFNNSNNNIDLSSITHSVHFTDQQNQTNRLPFSSTYITSIPESIVPASGTSSTNDNHFIPIHYIESPSLEDREVFETFHTKQISIPGVAIRQSINSLNRNISSSETDLIASLHRSSSKQGLDNQSDHGTTYSGTSDDMIFGEWDKERSLFQDYINSLRTEIRVLLQERLEYQKYMEIINNNLSEHKRLNLTQINIDQTKFDLLQKSLEEKNLVLEQLQKEYEITKEKNINLTRKISNLRCDAKAQTGVIDELKQKIAESTVDIQNHILIKRRLEITMMNLESDCKILDAERLRLNNDIKDTQLNKQDLEKLLQQANVQIAEQGSTIELLRSDNIQIRSQLSGTQRRMLQEKQQVMDYLRQIENDLIEKEQIKQRESILRKDFEKLQFIHKQDRQEIDQLNGKINQDQEKLIQLEQERLQLLKTIQNLDDKQIQIELELNSYKSIPKRLCTHFKIPFDSIQSIDQLIPILEDRYRTEQISQVNVHHIPLVQSTPEVNNEQEREEIRRLQEDLTSMNIQLKQLDEANQAWEQYQQNQCILLRDRLKLIDTDNLSFEDIVQQIEIRFNDLNNQLIEFQDVKKTDVVTDELPKHTDELQGTQLMTENIHQSKDTQTENNEEYQQEIANQNVAFDVKHYEEELRQLREDLAVLTIQCAQLDEANRAWQQYHQTQLDSFRNKLQDSLSIENSLSLDDIAQCIVAHLDQVQNEHDNLMQQLQTSDKLNHDLRSESNNKNQTIQQTYINTINELNQQLSLLKQQNDQLETEKYILNQQLENQSSINFNQERRTPTPDSISSDSKLVKKHTHSAPPHEAQIHNVIPVQSASPVINEQELQQLRETVTLLTNQCTQLDEANRAWQQYQQTQLDNFREKIQDYLPIDENLSLEQAAQQIVGQITRERKDFTEQYRALEKVNDDLRSESATNLETIKESYVNTINELNQELLAMNEKNEQMNDLTSANLLTQTFDEAPIPSNGSADEEELRQLREHLVSLTTQLDETNRAWQQYQQTQLDILRNQLENCLSIDYNTSFDNIAQQIADQVTREREDFGDKYHALERANNDLRSESSDNMDSIRQSYMNTVNELNQKLLTMKEVYDQLDAEKQVLINELEKRPIEVDQQQTRQTIEKMPSNILNQSFKEVPIHSSDANLEQDAEELQQLRESVVALTAQCAQLDQANRAWQQYQQTQLDNFQTKLHDYLPIDENTSFDEIAQQIANQVTKEREDFNERYQALERASNDLRSESSDNMESIRQSSMNTVNELNQELRAMKEAYDQLDAEKQVLTSELKKRPVDIDQEQTRQTIEKLPSNLLNQSFKEVPIHTSGANVQQDAEELQQLRESVVILTAQCAQLDEANRAWQQYQQTQLDSFQTKIHDYLPIDENTSFDEIAQQIANQVTKEREDFNERYQALERVSNDLRSESSDNMESIRQSYMNTVNELNQKLLAMKEAYDQLDTEKQVLTSELEKRPIEVDQQQARQTIEKVPSNILNQPFKEVPIHSSGVNVKQDAEELQQLRESVVALTAQCAQLDEANRAWQQYQQTQLDNFQTKLQDYLSIDENTSFDEIAQQIANQVTKEREDFNERYQALERASNDLRSGSSDNMESIRQSYMNTVNELNQKLLAMKEAYDELDAEKQVLISELEKRPIEVDQEKARQSVEKVPSDLFKQPFAEVPIHTSGTNVEHDAEELRQLRENVVRLTAQCAQLDEANRAWQLYQETQSDNFRTKLVDYMPIDENTPFDLIPQQIIDHITQEKEDFTERYQAIEKVNDDLRSESTSNLESIKESYMNTVNELNQELLAMKEAYEQLDSEKQVLIDELEKRPIELDQEQARQSIEKVPSNILTQPFKEVPIHTGGVEVEQNAEELQQLQESVARLTSRCAQLDEANRAWQQFQETQLDNFRTKFLDCLPIDETLTLDQAAQQIVDQITKEREDFCERYTELEKVNDDLRSESATDLETINQSYINTVNELNQKLLAMKEAYDQLDTEKQVLISELEKRPVDLDAEQNKQIIESSPINLSHEVPIGTSDVNIEEELQQLRANLAVLTSQYAQLNEANQAWQDFHQSQLTNFRTKVQDCIQLDDNFSFDQIAQQIVDEITKEREDFIEHYQALEKANNDLQSESIEEKKDFLTMKEQYQQVLREKELLINQIENRPVINNQERDTQTIESTNSNLLEEQTEMSQLRENLIAQLNETNRSWEQFEQRQLDLLKTLLPFSNETSLEEIIQEVILYTNHLTKEIDLFKEQERNSEYINNQYKQSLEEKRQANQTDDNNLEQELILLQNQYAQLDTANRSWQVFYDNQIDLLKNNFKNYIHFDNNLNFDQIIHLIVTKLEQLNQLDDSRDDEQLNKLQEENDLLMNQNQNLTNRLNQLERPSSPFVSQENLKQTRRTPIQEVQIHTIAPVQSVSSPNIEELQQLRINLSTLTTQCAQLDEANRAWQEYHQNQLEIFRHNLQDWIFLDKNSTLEQIAQEIIIQFDQLGNHKQNDNQLDVNLTIESLNKKLLDVYQDCEQFREHNAQLSLSKQQIQQQLEECQQQINDLHSNSEELVHLQQYNDSLNLENQKLQVKLNDTEQRLSQLAVQRVDSPRENVAIHDIDRQDEIRQLRIDLAAASTHCLQLEEANRAWQKYQYEQIESFRQNLQEQIPSFNQIENPSLDFIAQQIIDYLNQLNIQRDNLIRQNDLLKDELQLQKQQIERPGSADGGKRMFRRLSQDKHIREAQIHNVSPVQSASPVINEQELQQLRETVTLLTNQCAQLDEANRAWQQYQQTQLDNFREKIQDYLPIDENLSLEQAAQQIVDQITKERKDFTEQYRALERTNDDLLSESTTNLETINKLNQELIAMNEKNERTNDLTSANLLKQTFDEVPIPSNGSADEEELRQLREHLVLLTTQIDETNRAWEQYQQTQLGILRNQLENCLSIDYNTSFDNIAQQIVDQVTREREDFNEQYRALERASNDLRSESSDNMESIRQSSMNTVNELNQKLLTMKEAYDQLDAEKQVLINELEKRPIEVDQQQTRQSIEKVPSNILNQPFKEVPIHSSGVNVEQDAEELQQLRESVVALTAQCAQLDEANRAWQQYQQTQLDNFQTKLHDCLPIDGNTSFDEIAQQIADQITKEREDFSERYAELEKINDDLRSESTVQMQSVEKSSTENVDELNEEFLNLKNRYEELEMINKQLLFEKEDLSNQLNDRSIVVGHYSAFGSNLVEGETPIEWKHESNVQLSSIPNETEEILQIRSNLAAVTSQLTELTQSNETELNSFRTKLQNWISLSSNSTLDEIAQQLNTEFEQQQNLPQTTENQTQTIEPSEKVHIAIETIPLTYENHQTQIDPIDMIDQQIQTESFQQLWSNSDDENLFNHDEDDDRLQVYIDEITSLSSLDLSNRLNKECQQILSKQNFKNSPHQNLELNHFALITIYSLYNQHLIDDAKQLYNETLIRALKEEYELINIDKTNSIEKYLTEINLIEKKFNKLQNQYDDLLEHNELEHLHSKQLLEKYEFNLHNLHQENENLKYNFKNLEENYQQIKEQNYEQLKQDYDELINQNELLKDYNSQIYQQKLQDPNEIKSSYDIDIQCNLSEEIQLSDGNDDNTDRDLPIQEQGFEKLSSEEEINRLKTIISEIQLENEILKEFNSQNAMIDSAAHQSIIIDNYVQTKSENKQKSSSETEDNDWNAQMSPDEQNVSSITKQTVDNETQTEEQLHDKLVQVNNKLKRALQTMKDKIHQAVIERPQLFPDIGDDTIERLDHLISTIENQATQIDSLHNECEDLLQRNQQLEKDIQSNIDISKNNSIQTDFNQDKQNTKINDDDEEPSLTNRLFGFIANVTSSSRTNEFIDNETQTDEQPQDKLTQVNNKLKRALQTMKDKIHQAVVERPQLFPDIGDDTIERLDHLISTIGNQVTQIDGLQNEINQLQSSLEACQYQIENERPIKTEQLVSAAPISDEISPSIIEDYEKEIKQLQQKLSQNEDERTLLRQRLNEIELEFTKTLDDRSSTVNMYEEQLQSIVQERNALVEQLQEELIKFKQTSVTSNEDVKSLQEIIQQQSEELKDVSEKYFALASQIDAQDELDKQKKDTEERLNNYENQIKHLIQENSNLLGELQNKVSSPVQTIDNESQTDDQQHDKLVQVNNKLKRVLQTFKEKIHRIVTERPDLFVNIGEETNERLDYLISSVEYQATQIDILQAEREQSEEQFRNEIQELQSALEACQYQLANERTTKTEQLVSPALSLDDISPSINEDSEKQIKQLQQKLSQNEDERTLLRQRLNEVELEFTKIIDDRLSAINIYEEQLKSIVQERNTLVEQQVRQSAERQHDMEQLQQELDELKQSSVSQSVDISLNEEIQSLKDEVEQKSEELKDLSEKYLILSSQFDSNVNLQLEFDRQRKEIEERLIDYENQIENLTRERTNLLGEIQKNASSSSVQTTDNEKQTDDQKHEKLVKINNKFKRALQTFKEKLHRVVTERPDLFINIGEETSERLDHLISIVEHQATQIDILQAERGQSEEQLRNEIRELQGSVEAYRYQIENERPIKTEQLVSAVPTSDEISPSIIEDYEKQIKQLQRKLSQNEDERTLLRQRLNEVELEFTKTLDDRSSTVNMYEEQLQSIVQERNALVEQQVVQSAESQHEIEQLQGELAQLKKSDKDIKSLKEIIELQSEQLKHLNEKYIAVSSELESQAELDRQKKEIEQRLIDYQNQIENLTRERTNLLEEIQKNDSSSSVQTTDNEKQTDDQKHEKLVKINNKFKRALQTFKEKLHRVVTERPDLFINIGEETSERLDHLISIVEHQATQIDILQAERDQSEEELRNEIRELQNSFDLYRQQIDNENQLKHISSSPAMVQEIETEILEHKREIQPSQTSNDNQWNDWSTDSSQIRDEKPQHSTDHQEPSVANRLFGFFKNVTSPWSEETPTNDWNDQNSPLQFQSEESQQIISSPTSTDNLTEIIKNKIQQIIFEYPDLFPNSDENILNNLDQFISIIKNLQNQIKELQSLLTTEEHQKQIDELNERLSINQNEIERLTSERENYVASSLTKYQNENHVEIQTDIEPLTPSDQRVSRRVFEQEILAWSKESEQLKQLVKQIQIENKKLKDIILKFERMIHDYMHENERLKQENQQFAVLSYSLNTENSTSSDTDICYLTLKWLTYEVAQRTLDNNEQLLLITDDNEPYLKQRLIDTEQQLKSIRIQNQKLKKQVETYTIQFKHIQHEMNTKIQELSTLKIEIDRLRTSETQYRLEVDRLKADLQCDQVKFQQVERELTDLKFERTNIDNSSTNNLRELLQLKERELNALKDKLDYTIQAHQLELQEAIKANQFSLDNVQRFEQLDQRHQAKRKELEIRLGKICKIVKPFMDNQYLFREESMIDIDQLQQLITDTEAEERVINSLGPIRDCLGILESQMKELHDNLIENHARRSKQSKYRLGFESSSHGSQGELTHNVHDLQRVYQNPNLFLESSYDEPITIDFIENDVRLCLDDILDEIIVRTTVK